VLACSNPQTVNIIGLEYSCRQITIIVFRL
jgi:hypothetical protein